MKWQRIVVGSIALVAAVVAVVGALLPKHHVARQPVVIHPSEDAVPTTTTVFAASPGYLRALGARHREDLTPGAG